MSKLSQKLATTVAVLTMVAMPLQSAGALTTGGTTTNNYSASQSAYRDKWMPYSGTSGQTGNSAYDQNLDKLKDSFGIGSGSSSNGSSGVSNQPGYASGSNSSSNFVSVGSTSSSSGGYGSSAVPGGYQYNPAVSNKVSINSSGVQNKVTVGSGYNSGYTNNQVPVGNGSYGSSALPGGYQYNPAVSNKVAIGSSTNGGYVNNKVSVGTGNYGSSALPGGYQYNPNVNNKVAVGSGSTGTGYGTGNVNNKVAYASGSGNYGNSAIPGGYQYNPNVNNKVAYAGGSYDQPVNNKVAYATGDSDQVDNKVPYNPDNFDNNDDNEDTHQTEDISLCDGRPYPNDIDGHWSEIYVRRLYDLCVVEGYEDGNFRPNANVTRAELVKMGLFANGIEPNRGCYDNDCGSPFRDLDSWQGQWVRPAHDRGIVEGYLYNEFRPNQAITRAEAVKVVLATYGYTPTNDTKSFFNDVHGWQVGWVERARLIGLVQGIGNGNFDPNRPITRAEAAKVVAKMIEYWDTSVAKDNLNR